MPGKSGDSTKVRLEGNTKELKQMKRRDDLTVKSDVLWFEPFALLPDRFGAAYDDTMIGVE